MLLGPFCFHTCLNTLGKDGAFPEGIALWFPNWEQEKVVHKSKVIFFNNLVNIDKKIQMKVLEPWPGLFLSNKKTINFLGDLQKKLLRKKRATFFWTTRYIFFLMKNYEKISLESFSDFCLNLVSSWTTVGWRLRHWWRWRWR